MFCFLANIFAKPSPLHALLLLFLASGTLGGCQQGSLNVLPEEAAQGVVGKIAWVSDKAYAYQAGGEKARAYKWNAVFRGQWVETERRSAIAISFADGTRVFLGESARLLIDDYAYHPQTAQGTADYKFSVGSMRFISGTMNPSAVGIETPTAKIGFTGSDTLIFVTPEGETIVNVFEGTFTVRNVLGSERTATQGGETVTVVGAPENRAARTSVSANENISVSPEGILSNKGVGSKQPSSREVDTRGDGGSPRTKVSWEVTAPQERDDISRDWNKDIETLDPGVFGASPMHAGRHGEAIGGGGGGSVKAPSDPGDPGHGVEHDHPAPGDPGHGGDHDGHGEHETSHEGGGGDGH